MKHPNLPNPFGPVRIGPLLPFGGNTLKKLMREEFNEPNIDLFETPKEVVATAEVPGVKKEELSVKITENGMTLTVKQNERHEHESKERGKYEYSFSSRFQGYSRYIPFPSRVAANKAKATYKNGVLEIRAPKIAPQGHHAQKEVKID
ncbi:MAG: Hsp20/alpha crystallin family protein [Candidatus Micrarchaeia archaeon]|jgi:HSP20 family protein